jgi:hypothetical protein
MNIYRCCEETMCKVNERREMSECGQIRIVRGEAEHPENCDMFVKRIIKYKKLKGGI